MGGRLLLVLLVVVVRVLLLWSVKGVVAALGVSLSAPIYDSAVLF
jgi:hypothetical protein